LGRAQAIIAFCGTILPAKQRLKLTEAAILVFRASTSLQAAPGA
jgi:hypothetical protein